MLKPWVGVQCSSCLFTHGTNKVAEWHIPCATEGVTQYRKLCAVMGTCLAVLEAAGIGIG